PPPSTSRLFPSRRSSDLDACRDARHHHWSKACLACLHDGRVAADAGFDQLIEVRQQDNAFHDGNSKQSNKADRCRNAERGAGEHEREDAADHRHGDDRYAQEGIGQRGEVHVQQYANEQDSQGDNHPEALDRVLEVAEFADPFQAIPRRQRHFFRNLSLRLEHRAAQIPSANAEFDGNIALLLFAVDERRAGHQVDARDLAEGYLRDLVSDRILDRDRQTTDRLYVLPIFWREPNDQREVPIASLLIEIARGLPADGGLNRRIDVTGRQPIT